LKSDESPANLPNLLLCQKKYPKGAVKGFKNIWLLPIFLRISFIKFQPFLQVCALSPLKFYPLSIGCHGFPRIALIHSTENEKYVMRTLGEISTCFKINDRLFAEGQKLL
jgi:hypothetical protein